MRCYFNFCRQSNTFLVAQSHCTDTVIAVSRPGVADKTITSGTDKSVPYSYRFEFRQNRYILQQSSAYGADLFTPHLPQAASSPQAPQGEDKWGAPQKLNTVLTYGGSFPVSSVTSTPGSRNMRIGSCVKAPLKKRGSYGLFHYLEPGYRNNRIRSCPNSPLKRKNRDGGYRSGFLNAYYQSCF